MGVAKAMPGYEALALIRPLNRKNGTVHTVS
jgi:hypothetical protein